MFGILLQWTNIIGEAILFNWSPFAVGEVFSDVRELNCTEWRCSGRSTENNAGSLCHCDKTCMLYGDCCYEFYDTNFSQKNLTEFLAAFNLYLNDLSDSNPHETYWINFVKKYGKCQHNFGALKSESYEMITSCPGDTDDDDLVDKCEGISEDFMTEVPVSYIGKGNVHVAFRNMYCSKCHKISQESIIPWSVHVRRNCTDEINKDSSVQRVLPLNEISPSCIDIKKRPFVDNDFRFLCFPDNSGICKDQEIEKDDGSELVCDTYYHGLTVNVGGIDFNFKNPHCITCSSHRNFYNITCNEFDNGRFHPSFDEKLDVNLVVLFDFRRGVSIQVNQNVYVRTEDLCASNFIYDTILQTCIEVICPDSQRLSSSGCIYNEASWSFKSDSSLERTENKTYVLKFNIETPLLISASQFELIKTEIGKGVNDLYDIALYYELSEELNEIPDIQMNEETTTRASRKGNKGNSVVKQNKAKPSPTTTQLAQHLEQSTSSINDEEGFVRAQFNINDTENRTEIHTRSSQLTTEFATTSFDTGNSRRKYVYDIKVIIARKSKINGEIDKIVQSLLNIPETRVFDIIVQNLNFSIDCEIADEKYVKMETVVKINGYYYGVDNASRALVDIDITEFDIHFSDAQVTYADLKYCKTDSLNCTMGLYNMSDFTFLDNGTLIDKVSNRILGKQNYLMRGTNVLTCINLSAVFRIKIPELVSKHETLLSIIMEAVSVFCLYTTGILYSGCFGIKTCNSRSIMFLSFTLGTAQCLFFIPANGTEITCKMKAVALHFFWLSSFFWMSVIGFDYAKTFRIGRSEVRQMNKSLDLKYAIFAYGIPLGFITVCVCVDELLQDQIIGYGVDVCWIGKTNAYFLVFAVPVLIIIFVNISFFTCTVIGINRAKFNIKNMKTTHNRSLIIVYIKLCLIMGLTWIIAFVAGYFDVDFLWLVHIFMNGLQGLDIFLTFVLNKRTIKALRNKKPNKYSPTNKQTLSSNVSTNSLSSTTYPCNNNESKF